MPHLKFLVFLLFSASESLIQKSFPSFLFRSTLLRAASTHENQNRPNKILVIGRGFLGNTIINQLDQLDIDHVTVSKSVGSNADYQLDLTKTNSIEQIQQIANGCDAVISTVGSIGNQDDFEINASSGNAAIGAKLAGVERFVFIGNEERIRDFALTTSPLRDYASGKQQAEDVIRENFPNSHTIIQPNFIYGGETFSFSPPRVPSNLGGIAEDILGLYPFQALSEKLPGMLGVAAGAPVSRERVAAAAINAAIGVCTEKELKSRNDIVLAASKRLKNRASNNVLTKEKHTVRELKEQIYEIGDCGGDKEKLQHAFVVLEEIENQLERNPATDPILNGRWDFDFDVEADAGSGIVKDILEGNSPVPQIFNVDDICLKIFEHSGQQKVNVYVNTKILNWIDIDLIVKTSILPDESCEDGTMFLERFEGIRLAGIPLPIPDDWKKGRPLEFSYLDETMLIARGNGGDPHYLRREAENCDIDLENCYL